MKPIEIGLPMITRSQRRQIVWDQCNYPDTKGMLDKMRVALARGHRNDLYMDAELLINPCISMHVVEVTEEGRLSLRMGAKDPFTGLPKPKALRGLATIIDCGKNADMILLIVDEKEAEETCSVSALKATCEART